MTRPYNKIVKNKFNLTAKTAQMIINLRKMRRSWEEIATALNEMGFTDGLRSDNTLGWQPNTIRRIHMALLSGELAREDLLPEAGGKINVHTR